MRRYLYRGYRYSYGYNCDKPWHSWCASARVKRAAEQHGKHARGGMCRDQSSRLGQKEVLAMGLNCADIQQEVNVLMDTDRATEAEQEARRKLHTHRQAADAAFSAFDNVIRDVLQHDKPLADLSVRVLLRMWRR